MITINDSRINIAKFSDGTRKIILPEISYSIKIINIKWLYSDESELLDLVYIVNAIRDSISYGGIKKICLLMPYVPNARMDRIESNDEVFTLKYFANIINSLEFSLVQVFDAHSRVTPALINRVQVISPREYISISAERVLGSYEKLSDLVLFFPDRGAMERYKKILDQGYFNSCAEVLYGEKHRDWETGKLEGTITVFDSFGYQATIKKENPGRKVLIIDDIISSGGTIAESVSVLKNILDFKDISVYCSHLENRYDTEPDHPIKSLVKSKDIRFLFTTNSIYRGKNAIVVCNL